MHKQVEARIDKIEKDVALFEARLDIVTASLSRLQIDPDVPANVITSLEKESTELKAEIGMLLTELHLLTGYWDLQPHE